MGDIRTALFFLKKMNKAMYAAVFLGLCAIVLLVHVQVNTDDVESEKQAGFVQDPFLANLEAHVVAKAQRRLRQKAMQEKRNAHINDARKAMKTMLLNAASSAQDTVAKAEAEEQKEKKVAKKKAAAKAQQPKTYTWAQLQDGADKAKETQSAQKMGSLLNNLKAAPKADKNQQLRALQQQKQDAKAHKAALMSNALADAKAKAKAEVKHSDDDDDDFE